MLARRRSEPASFDATIRRPLDARRLPARLALVVGARRKGRTASGTGCAAKLPRVLSRPSAEPRRCARRW